MKEQDEFGVYFRTIQLKFSYLYTRILTRMELTLPQYALLNELGHSGSIPMTRASEELRLTKPAVTHLVDQLEKRKLIKRVPHATDRRISLLKIEPKGKKLVQTVQSKILQFLLKTLGEFSSAERASIIRFYEKLSNTVDGMVEQF